MRNKPSFKINMPEINIYILIIGITSLILIFYNLYIGCLFFFGFIYIVFHNWRIANFRKKEWNKYIENLSLDIDETTKKAINGIRAVGSDNRRIPEMEKPRFKRGFLIQDSAMKVTRTVGHTLLNSPFRFCDPVSGKARESHATVFITASCGWIWNLECGAGSGRASLC